MNGKVFNALSMGQWDLGIVFIIMVVAIFALLIVTIVMCIESSKLKRKYERFTQGRDGKSLEKEIGEIFIENAALREISEKNKRDIRTLFRRMEPAFQRVGLVKYDAFPQMGGKLSFSLAMLDEKKNGVIINSVHGSDGCYTYSKEIKGGRCDLVLGEEEKKALSIALQD